MDVDGLGILVPARGKPHVSKVACPRDDAIAALPNYACYLYAKVPLKAEEPLNVRVYNTFAETLDIAWDDGSPDGVFSGHVDAGEPMVTTSYVTHRFIFKSQRTKKKMAGVTMVKDKRYYFIGPGMTDTMSSTLKAKVQRAVDFIRFSDDYKSRTGRFWLGDFPAAPLRHRLLKAEFVGQTYNVTIDHGYWTCGLEKDCVNEPLELQAVVASLEPRVILVENFLHEEERKLVVEQGKLAKGTVGDGTNSYESDTRRSEVGWINWSPAWMQRILARTSVLLGFAQEDLHGGQLAEDLQVVRYKTRGMYAAHHDFGDRPMDRMLTFLHYISSPPDGGDGGTSFPLAFGGKGLNVRAPPGTSVLFYSQLEDGNKDELSLHEARLVKNGTKFVCNSWIHDRSSSLERMGYQELNLKHEYFDDGTRSEL